MKQSLSIITIAYEENQDLIETYNSIQEFLQEGAVWILVIKKGLKIFELPDGAKIIEGQDRGLYDALNLGLNVVTTDYFMLLHSGDIIFDRDAFSRALKYTQDGYDCVLGGARIGNRIHKSRYWQKWMLRFYVQPPHLPIIYKTQSCFKERYNIEINTVADFYYLRNLLLRNNFKYKQSGEVYIRMAPGGLTTSGLRSFIHVTTSFMQVDGIVPLLVSPFRFFLKVILR